MENLIIVHSHLFVDWPQHKKICPGKNRPAQSLVLTVPVPPGAKSMPGDPPWPSDVPVKVYRKMDGYNNSGVALVYSDHLGLERLHSIAQIAFGADGDDPSELNRVARTLVEQCEMWQPHVTSPVDPSHSTSEGPPCRMTIEGAKNWTAFGLYLTFFNYKNLTFFNYKRNKG